jgi:peptide/nickel transport system substrate-binding protein
VLDWTVYNSRLAGDGFGELYLWGMGSYTDASSIFVQDFKRHYDWSDPAFEDLARTAGNAKTEAERIALSQQAQKIVAEQRVRIGLLLPQSIYGVSDRVVYDGRFDEMIAAEDVGRP